MHENIFSWTAANKHHICDPWLPPWLVWFGWMKRNILRIAYQISNCNDVNQMVIEPIFFLSHLNEWREPYSNQCCSTFNKFRTPSINIYVLYICIFTLEHYIYLLNFFQIFFASTDCLQNEPRKWRVWMKGIAICCLMCNWTF